MITCQHEWIQQCLIKYRYEPLPEGEHWEDAHYPIPECRNGTETVRLWSRDHAVHGFLQSEDLDQVCFHGFRRKTDRALIEEHYPEYLELCDRWFSDAQRRALQKAIDKDPEHQAKAGRVSGNRNTENGVLDRAREVLHSDKDEQGKSKHAVKIGKLGAEKNLELKNEEGKSINAVKGGQKSSASLHKEKDEQGRSLHAMRTLVKAHQKKDENGKSIVSTKCHQQKDELGRSVHAVTAGRKGLETINSRKWKCLVTGHISTAGPLSLYQRARGIDTSLRIRVG